MAEIRVADYGITVNNGFSTIQVTPMADTPVVVQPVSTNVNVATTPVNITIEHTGPPGPPGTGGGGGSGGSVNVAYDIPASSAGVPITIVHNLGSMDILVSIVEKATAGSGASTGDIVDVSITIIDANSIRLVFANVVAANKYRAVINVGSASTSTFVGPLTANPDPGNYSQWVVSPDEGPWDSPIADGTFALMVSNGTSWFGIAGGSAGGGMAGPVTITTTGSTFSPKLLQVADSPNEIEWKNQTTDTVVGTGPNPTINFGSGGVRTIEMWCSRPQDVLTFNLGYNSGDDTGNFLPGPAGGAPNGEAYNYTAQQVSSIDGLPIFTNLVNFMSANNALTGHVDFSGLSNLQFIECAYSHVNTVDLTGCTSLVRLCLEQNDTHSLDLNPIRGSLKDLRSAYQTGGAGGLTLTPLTGPMTQLYHFCVRGQTVTNMPAYTNFPALTEHWTWATGQSGTFVAPPLSLDLRVDDNSYTALDFSHTTSTQSFGRFTGSRTPWTSVTGWATGRRFALIEMVDCNMSTALVDQILANVNSWGNNNGEIYLNGSGVKNGVPTGGDSNSNVVALRGRGWTVSINT